MEEPKILVAIRKRPLSQKETSKGETDIITVKGGETILISEQKVKVDLTKYIEESVFNFDFVFNEQNNNEQIYEAAVRPLVQSAFKGAKVTCFAYGQTGSGKTFTMNGSLNHGIRGLYSFGAEDIFSYLQEPCFEHLKAKVSFFEIYCGKLFDLLNKRQQLKIREDNKNNINIIGLEEANVTTSEQFQEILAYGSTQRVTSQNSANSQSSRSHAILQISLKDGKRIFGKISFIDLAGNQRGADHMDMSKQTRIDGAQINKSLLSLKECIRALDQAKEHVPFRGSKLTMVLKDSFVGFCRTIMIGNISPSSASSENSLNTLRYADRVKELRKPSEGISKEDAKARELMLPRQKNNAIRININNDDDADDIAKKRQDAQKQYGLPVDDIKRGNDSYVRAQFRPNTQQNPPAYRGPKSDNGQDGQFQFSKPEPLPKQAPNANSSSVSRSQGPPGLQRKLTTDANRDRSKSREPNIATGLGGMKSSGIFKPGQPPQQQQQQHHEMQTEGPAQNIYQNPGQGLSFNYGPNRGGLVNSNSGAGLAPNNRFGQPNQVPSFELNKYQGAHNQNAGAMQQPSFQFQGPSLQFKGQPVQFQNVQQPASDQGGPIDWAHRNSSHNIGGNGIQFNQNQSGMVQPNQGYQAGQGGFPGAQGGYQPNQGYQQQQPMQVQQPQQQQLGHQNYQNFQQGSPAQNPTQFPFQQNNYDHAAQPSIDETKLPDSWEDLVTMVTHKRSDETFWAARDKMNRILFEEEGQLINMHQSVLKQHIQITRDEMKRINELEKYRNQMPTRQYTAFLMECIQQKLSSLQMLRETLVNYTYKLDSIEKVQNVEDRGDDEQLLDDLN